MNVQKKKTNIDSDGNLQSYMPAEPLKMTCEAKGCSSTEGQDYKRKNASKGWEDEPIFLCSEHSLNYQKIK